MLSTPSACLSWTTNSTEQGPRESAHHSLTDNLKYQMYSIITLKDSNEDKVSHLGEDVPLRHQRRIFHSQNQRGQRKDELPFGETFQPKLYIL